MSKLTKEEIMLKHLLIAEQRKPNKVCFGTENYNGIKGIAKSEFVKILDNLEKDNLVSTYFYGRHDTSTMCEITLLSGGIHYFENKKREQKANRRVKETIIREWITIVISVIALILSVFSIYLQCK